MGRRHSGEDPDSENEILVWRYKRGSKTRQGQDKAYSVRAFHPTAQATGNERCLVKIFKEFARRRPLEMNKPDSPVNLAVKHKRKPVTTYGICEVLLVKMKSANFSLPL